MPCLFSCTVITHYQAGPSDYVPLDKTDVQRIILGHYARHGRSYPIITGTSHVPDAAPLATHCPPPPLLKLTSSATIAATRLRALQQQMVLLQQQTLIRSVAPGQGSPFAAIESPKTTPGAPIFFQGSGPAPTEDPSLKSQMLQDLLTQVDAIERVQGIGITCKN